MAQPAHNDNHTTAIYDRSGDSLVLGIISVVLPFVGWIGGIIAIVFAAKTMSAYKIASLTGAGAIISQNTGKPVTRGTAIAGLVTGIIGVTRDVSWILLIVLFWGA